MAMLRESIKSPLVLSIGGVGLLASGMIAWSYARQAKLPTSLEAGTLTQSAEADIQPIEPTSADPWERAMEYGWNAAVAAQTATTEGQWRRVGDLWLLAIAELEQVPKGAPNKAEAQNKIQEYLVNFEYAENRKAEARKASPANSLGISTEAFQAAFGDDKMGFTFQTIDTPEGSSLKGESPDGLATIEVIGKTTPSRATLTLNTADTSQPSMAHIVYANRFLKAADPQHPVPNNWLATNIKAIQTNPQQPIVAEHGTHRVTIHTKQNTKSLLITITSDQ
jgi:hypothetical protein